MTFIIIIGLFLFVLFCIVALPMLGLHQHDKPKREADETLSPKP